MGQLGRLTWFNGKNRQKSFTFLFDLSKCDISKHEKNNPNTAKKIVDAYEKYQLMKYRSKVKFIADHACWGVKEELEKLDWGNLKTKYNVCLSHSQFNVKNNARKEHNAVADDNDQSSK